MLIRDHLGRGQSDFVYRLELNTPQVSLANGIPRVDRYSQTRQTIAIPQGGRYVSLMNAARQNFGGPLEIGVNDLPDGVTASAPPMAPNLNIMPVMFEAAADAPIDGRLTNFHLQLADPQRQVVGNFGNLSDFMLGPPNNAVYVGCRVDKLAVSVVEKLPFSIELVQPKVPIVRNGQMQLKVLIQRDEGFNQPVQLQFPFRPPGIGTTNQIQVPAEKSEAYYPINANGSAQLGKWPVYVLGISNVGGPAYACSKLIELEISQPFVTVAINRASVEQGQPLTLSGTVNKILDFEGQARVRLLGLPPEVIAPEATISAASTEVTFAATTTAKSPPGNHKGIICQVLLPQNGETVVSTAGSLELQIAKPIVQPTPDVEQTQSDRAGQTCGAKTFESSRTIATAEARAEAKKALNETLKFAPAKSKIRLFWEISFMKPNTHRILIGFAWLYPKLPVLLIGLALFLALALPPANKEELTGEPKISVSAASESINSQDATQSAAAGTVTVFPGAVQLSHARDTQTIVVQLQLESGITRDITTECILQIENPQLAEISGQMVVPKADGQTHLSVQFEGQMLTVPVSIENAKLTPPISFQTDVMPVFMKAGCNSGSCHGAARGKDGFRLSLYGFDPAGDYHRLTREMPGRRINLSLSDQSLLLQKATGSVAHTGGDAIKVDDPHYQVIQQWIEAGAMNDQGPVPSVVALEIMPRGGVLNGSGATQQLTVLAKYSDGSDRDVTSLAYFSSNNDNSASVDQQGVITAANRGEAFVMARFDTHTVGSPFIVLPKDLAFQWQPTDEFNYIDRLVHDKLKKLRIQPSGVCSDEQFIRRVTIDICGQVPGSEEIRSFVADPDPEKRARLIDQLLERKEFVELWVMKWSELLTIRSSQQVSYKSALLYFNWLESQIANNVPIDEMVVNLLGAKGGTFSAPATNFYQAEQDTLKLTENVAQVFMGMRIQCAQCHNHPFDRWTMDDYYSFASFFSQVGRKQAEDPRERIVFNRRNGEINHPVQGKPLPPKFLGGEAPETRGKDRREVVANWLVSPDNPFFSKNLANIVWAHFFGRGIVDPVDDVRISNPASNQQLLDELARRLVATKYDFKQLVRDICNSRTYQLSTATNETNATDLTNFSHAQLRRIRAEVLLDIISQVTETKDKFAGLPLGAKAVQIADGNTSNYFLNTFGRAQRLSVCSCEVKTEPNLSQALHLLNGQTVQGKIQQGNVVGKLLAEKLDAAAIITELYMRVLARDPSPSELEQLLAVVGNEPDQKPVLDDLFWALLNSREFVFNH